MQYSFFVAWRYMKKHISRTIYSIFGITITFILCFSIFTIGYSFWDYMYLTEGGLNYQLWLDELWTNEDSEVIGITEEQIEQVKKLEQCDEIKKLLIYTTEWPEENGDFDEDSEPVYTYYTADELKKGDDPEILIALKDISNLRKSAESLQEKTGLAVEVDSSVEEYLRQDDGKAAAAYSAVVSMVAAIFSFFCVILLRNTMTISVVERMRDYGLWRCVGMSGKQLYRQLAVEGFIMSLVSAVCGVVAGFGILRAMTPWLNRVLELDEPFTFGVYPQAVLYTVLLCVAVTLFALLEPARQVGHLSPIEAIQNNIVLQGRKGKLREKIQYRQSRLWSFFFGVSGEYAYKNMHRNRGRSMGLFFSLMLCVCLIGMTQSGVESIYATVENSYQGQSVEYLEEVYPDPYEFKKSVVYDEKVVSQIKEELKQLDSVQNAAVIFEKAEASAIDPVLKDYINQDVINVCLHYAYDREHIDRLKKYVLEGEADYDAMTEQKGVLLCDMEYNVATSETDFNQADVRRTEYKVGDTITLLKEEARQRVREVYGKALHQVAGEAGMAANWIEASEEYQKEQEEKEKAGEEIAEEDNVELDYLEGLEKGEEGYKKYQKRMLELIAKEGYEIQPEDIADLHADPETGTDDGHEDIGSILESMEQWEYDRGEREVYIIQGILSEDPINSGNAVNYASSVSLIYSQDAVLADETVQNPTFEESMQMGNVWSWSIGVKRDPLDLQNKEVEKYCREQETGLDLTSCYIFEGTDYDIQEYLDMLKSLHIVRMIVIIIIICIGLICLIQIFNTICANIVLRRRELWLYGMVGMSRRQKYRMLLLEHGVVAVSAVIFGYLTAWGTSWYLIEYLLNQEGKIHYTWPWAAMLLVCAGILFLVELISVLGIRSTSV